MVVNNYINDLLPEEASRPNQENSQENREVRPRPAVERPVQPSPIPNSLNQQPLQRVYPQNFNRFENERVLYDERMRDPNYALFHRGF